MEEFNYDNEIIEISNDETSESLENIESLEETKEIKPKKKSFKDKWDNLPKKNKVLIIVLLVLILLLVMGIILYFTLFEKEDHEPKPEPVVLEKDNYRYEDGNLVFLNASEKEIGTYTCQVKDANKCFVAKLNYSEDNFDRVMSVDKTGKELEKTSTIYNNRFVFINDNEKITLYDIENKEVLMEVTSFKPAVNSNLVIVENEKKSFGLIEIKDDTYEYLIRCSYDYLGLVNEKLNYLVAKDKDNTYVIDSTGKKLSKNINTTIKSVDENYIVGYKNDSYQLYDYDYNELLSDYDFIGLHDSVISTVKSKRLYLLNDNLNKLHEDGIRLENYDYIKKYVYEDNKLVKTLKSYDINIEEDTAKVTIGNDIKEINLFEGIISANTDYVSYFDGTLYFYGDKEKVDIIGEYSCQNKNNIKSSTDTLNNCFVYVDSNGASGIYNNEYVFIHDDAMSDGATYYLYSLKEKKNKGTYSELEFINKNELSPSVKPYYTSSSFIIAKSAIGNNKNNYGVLEITGSKVVGKVEFKYESIKKEKNYFLLINVDKTYSIYNSNFKKISNEFNYIEIYDNYYVGINNDKLNVYKYDNAIGILESDLPVTDNKFTIDFTNGFNITIDGTTYSYTPDGKVVEGELDGE